MKRIEGYDIGAGVQEVEIPAGSQILSVGVYQMRGQLWVLVNPDGVDCTWRVFAVGVGATAPVDPGYLVGRMELGPYVYQVYHVFVAPVLLDGTVDGGGDDEG